MEGRYENRSFSTDRYISKTIQDMTIVTYNESRIYRNSCAIYRIRVISNDLNDPLTQILRQYSTLNISVMAQHRDIQVYYGRLIGTSIHYNLLSGAISNDLE